MNAIQSITLGRLIDPKNVNAGISTDFSNKNYTVPALLANMVNGSKYMVVVSSVFIDFISGSLDTTLIHYEYSGVSNKWNRLETINIDAEAFPNLNKLITDRNVLINALTGDITDTSNEDVYDTVITTNSAGQDVTSKVLKSVYLFYYKHLRFSSIGLGIESMITSDVRKRLLKYLVS